MKLVLMRPSYILLRKYVDLVSSNDWPTGMFLCRLNRYFYATKNLPILTGLHNTISDKLRGEL